MQSLDFDLALRCRLAVAHFARVGRGNRMGLSKRQLAMKTIEDRFETKFTCEPNSGCWLWTGATSTSGYGLLFVQGRARTASRVAWEISGRTISQGLQVLHHCDVRSCVNPRHLFLGTNADNVSDRVRKGRSARVTGDANGSRIHPERRPRGEAHWKAAVSDTAIAWAKEQRAKGTGPTAIARTLGVDRTTVQRWVRGESR